jgi:hypothetical protein
MAGTASLSGFISGKSKATAVFAGRGRLSLQSLSACMSPAFASSMAFAGKSLALKRDMLDASEPDMLATQPILIKGDFSVSAEPAASAA